MSYSPRVSSFADTISCAPHHGSPPLAAVSGGENNRKRGARSSPFGCGARAALCCIGLVLGCEDQTDPLPQTVIPIGAVESLTGDGMMAGTGLRAAINLAVVEINKAGGVLGKTLMVVHQDDASDPAKGAANAPLLVQRGVVGVIGGPDNGVYTALLAATDASKMKKPLPILAAAATSPALAVSDNLFRTAPSDGAEARTLGAQAKAVMPALARVAVVYSDNAWGRGMAAGFSAALGSAAVARKVLVPAGAMSLADEARMIVSDNPDGLALFTTADEATKLLPEILAKLPAMATPPRLLLSGRLHQQAFLDGLGTAKSLAEGALGVVRAPDPMTASAQGAFVAAFQAANMGADPPPYADSAYDAVYILAAAIQAAKSTDGAQLVSGLPGVTSGGGTAFGPGGWAQALATLQAGGTVNYDGASGRLELDDAGDARGVYRTYSVMTGMLMDGAVLP